MSDQMQKYTVTDISMHRIKNLYELLTKFSLPLGTTSLPW